MIDYSFRDACKLLKLSPWEVARACIYRTMPYKITGNSVMIPLEERIDNQPRTALPREAKSGPTKQTELTQQVPPEPGAPSANTPPDEPCKTIGVGSPATADNTYETEVARPTVAPASPPYSTEPTTPRTPADPFESIDTTLKDSPARNGRTNSSPSSQLKVIESKKSGPETKKYTCLDDTLRKQLTTAGWDAEAVDAVYRGFSTKGFTSPASYDDHIKGKIRIRYSGKKDIDKVFNALIRVGAIVKTKGYAYRLNQIWKEITDIAVRTYAQAFKGTSS